MPSDVLNTIVNRLNGGPSSEGYVDLSDGNGFIQLTQDGITPSAIIFGIWESSTIQPQYGGTGVSNAGTITVGGNLAFSGAFTFSGTLTGNTAVTFPTSGTLATTSSIPSLPISLANGGTGASLIASNGGIFYSTASAGAILSGTATANRILMSGASSTPSWSTATYPATTTINQILYSSAANTIGGLATANSGTLITSGAGVPSIQTLTAGQILVGTTASAPAATTLTSGAGISITSASGSITISATNAGNWINQNTSSVTLSPGTKYLINNGASLVTLTLPTTPTLGDTYEIAGYSSGGWQITQNASQNIQFSSTTTTAGITGYAASANQYDHILITYAANNTFLGVVLASTGGITIN